VDATVFKDVVTGETVTLELMGMNKASDDAILFDMTVNNKGGYLIDDLGHRGFTHLDAVKSGRFEIVSYGERAESGAEYI